MWNVLRSPIGRSGVTVADLALYATTDKVRVAYDTARRYAERLADAGYLIAGRTEPRLYKLKPAMNTGPRPPAVVQAVMIFDRNRGVIVGPVAGEEARS